MNFASGIKSGEIEIGIPAAKDLFDKRLVISIDPGLMNLAALTCSYGSVDAATKIYSGVFVKKLFSAKGVKNDTGLATYLEHRPAVEEAAIIRNLAELHGRTMNIGEYNAHSVNFQSTAQVLLESHNSVDSRKDHARLQSKHQRYWSNVVNLIFAMNDELAKDSIKAPLIIFGDGNFANVKGCLPGNYAWLKQYLSRFFTVLILEEFNTSQRCPKCFGQLELHEPKKGIRVKRCKQCLGGGPGGHFVVNRDVGAGMNMITIALCMITSGQRPAAFAPAIRY